MRKPQTHLLESTSIRASAFITMGAKYSNAVINLVYTVILARILTPDDFGIVALANVFVTFFTLLANMGFSSAVIQRQDLEREDISKIFGFTIIFSAVLALLFAILGHPMALLYRKPHLVSVFFGLAVTVLLSSLNTIPNALLLKSKRFLLVGIRGIVTCVVASMLGIVSAVLGAGYYAIIIYSISSALILLLWNLVTTHIKPIFRDMMTSVRDVFEYSIFLLGFEFIDYLSRTLDNLLVGYFFGTSLLGNYGKAYQLMRMPQTYLANVANPVLHPILAERQDDIEYIYTIFLRTVKILSLLGVFISTLFFFSANETINILYGSQWDNAIVCFQLLAISIWPQMTCGTSGAMFRVLNRTKEQFVRGVINALIIVLAILLGIWLGSVEAVSACVSIAYYVAFITMTWFLVKRGFGRTIKSFVVVFAPDVILAVVLIVTHFFISLISFQGSVLSFAVKLLVSGIVYLVFMVLLHQGKWLAFVLPHSFREKVPIRLIS